MKHPFHTLYYTGLAVLISIFLFSGLLISNIPNILELLPKNKTPKINTDVVINPTVLETTISKPFVGLNIPKVENKEITKTEILKSNTEDTNSTHNKMNGETSNTSNNQDTSQGITDTI